MPTLNWIGKDAVINHHLEVPFHLLKDVPELGCGDPGSGNLIVEGDNLVALKALLPYYKGKVKCICIDPPYNTGNEGWAYNDNVNSPAIKRWLGETVGKEGETLDRHDRWLCMMYPRLALLREFLSEDGSIFVFLDDNEIGHLRLIMDEIFAANNLVCTVAWQRRISPDARLGLGLAHDHVLVFNRNSSRRTFNKVPISSEQTAAYKNPDGDRRGKWVSTDFTAQGWRPNQMYKIVTPGGVEYEPPPNRCWGNIESEYLRQKAEGRMWFGKDGKGRPRVKTYLSETEGVSAWSWWPHGETGHNQEAKKEINSIMGPDVPFDTPKPTRLIERILQIATNPGDLVLDSFAGSGTTGHAVLKMNAAAKEAEARRFILVEMDEKIAPDITRERVKRVAEGYPARGTKGETVPGLGGSFRYVRLGDELFDEHGRINETKVRFTDLARHVYFSETGEPLVERMKDEGGRMKLKKASPLLGVHHGRAVYLLYNGILKDKSVDGGNVLTSATLEHLPAHEGPKVVYAAGCRFSKARLEREGITFKQTPYAIRTK
jgi:adenine-specific DNA-methyltransferase